MTREQLLVLLEKNNWVASHVAKEVGLTRERIRQLICKTGLKEEYREKLGHSGRRQRTILSENYRNDGWVFSLLCKTDLSNLFGVSIKTVQRFENLLCRRLPKDTIKRRVKRHIIRSLFLHGFKRKDIMTEVGLSENSHAVVVSKIKKSMGLPNRNLEGYTPVEHRVDAAKEQDFGRFEQTRKRIAEICEERLQSMVLRIN